MCLRASILTWQPPLDKWDAACAAVFCTARGIHENRAAYPGKCAVM
jgi:hypothetical protein